MKKAKKLLSVLIVATMIFAMTIPALASAAPTVASATVNGTSLVITFSEAIKGTAATDDFTVLVDSDPVDVTLVTVGTTTVTLTLDEAVAHDAVVTVAYDGNGTLECDDEVADVAAFPAYTVTNNTPDPDAGDWLTTETGTTTVTGDGEVIYVDTTVYEVLLPTADSWDFILDPQGLAGLADGEAKTQAELAATAGRIIVKDEAPTIINRSSVPIKLTAAITPTAGTDVNLVATTAAVEPTGTGEDDMNVLLAVVSSTASVNEIVSESFAGTHAVALTALQSLTYVLGSADYLFKNTSGVYSYDRDAASLGFGTSLQLAGRVNRNADWSDFTSLGISAVFSFEKAAATDVATPLTPPAYGLFGGPYTAVTGVEVVTLASLQPTIGFPGATPLVGAATIVRGATATVPFNYGSLTLKSVVFAEGGFDASDTATLVASGIQFVLPSSWVAGAYPLKITLSDDSEYTLNLTVTAS